jgi:polyferredoxin
MTHKNTHHSVFIKNKFISGFRNQLQLVVFLITLAMGLQFYLYVTQILGNGPVTVHRPTGVEGFLPIGALMGWKYFLATGIWESVHPASMVFLGFAVFISFIFRRSFCSWFCPVGTLSEWSWKLGERKMGKNYQLPVWVDVPLRGVKYALLGFFAWIILQMPISAMASFFESPYYKIADIKMLHFFTKMTLTTAAVLLVLTVLSFFSRNFWCRYGCPYGALVGLFSLFSPARIERDPDSCIHCGKCAKICPSHLPVDKKARIITPECTGCMDCVNICPANHSPENATLKLTFRMPKKAITPRQLGTGIVIIFCLLVYTAGITGHWKSRMSDQEFRMWLRMTDMTRISHPDVSSDGTIKERQHP